MREGEQTISFGKGRERKRKTKSRRRDTTDSLKGKERRKEIDNHTTRIDQKKLDRRKLGTTGGYNKQGKWHTEEERRRVQRVIYQTATYVVLIGKEVKFMMII